MAEIQLPRYLIAQKCLWGGWRQPSKPVFVRPMIEHFPVRVEVKETPCAPHLIGFDGWEYRFWAAVPSECKRSVIAECRGCMSVFSDAVARREHIGKMGCSKRLTAAYKLLLRDKLCVICNMRSYQEKWGVPLCSKTCMTAWASVESQPDALKAALVLVGEG